MSDETNTNALVPQAEGQDLQQVAITQADIDQQAPDWYRLWRGRIHTWVAHHSHASIAHLMLLVPDMFYLLVQLAHDKRVPFILKGQVLLAVAYVLAPLDLLSEALLGPLGLIDDLAVMILILLWLQTALSLEAQILRDHWAGDGDVQDVIQNTHAELSARSQLKDEDSATATGDDYLLNPTLWQTIQNRFAQPAETVIVQKTPEKADKPTPKRAWFKRRNSDADVKKKITID